MMIILFSFLVILTCDATSVRQDGGNCVGVRSCRPRCITFRLHRKIVDCSTVNGIFGVPSRLNPWDATRFRTFNCPSADTCFNDFCDESLDKNLTIRISEKGLSGSSLYTTLDLPESEDAFTFCSIYQCPKTECAVPEQMGFELQFEMFSADKSVDTTEALLVQEMYLKDSFLGPVLQEGTENRWGVLSVEWMDDPAGCRTGQFSQFAPVEPILDPTVSTNSTELDSSYFCHGAEYNPRALPRTRPPSPSTSPSQLPTFTVSPSVAPSLSPVRAEQLAGLKELHASTLMGTTNSMKYHNWFKNNDDHCSFTGIECDSQGYIVSIDLSKKYLAGILPPMTQFSTLKKLKLNGNEIGGSIPLSLGNLAQLTQLELATNKFTGTIPASLFTLKHLRRLMLQFNELEGSFPTRICNLTMLVAFDISRNIGIYGEIPDCMGNLPIEVLRVDDVGLVGRVPGGLCDLRSMNGLNPNAFGCSAIACPVGTYNPKSGRHDEESTCLSCNEESNVIGSLTCRVVSSEFSDHSPAGQATVGSFIPSAQTVSSFPSALPSAQDPSSSILPSSVTLSRSRSPSSSPETSLPPSPKSNNPAQLFSVVPSAAPSLHPSFKMISHPLDFNDKVRADTDPPKYWLFGMALGLAAFAVAAVTVLVRSRRSRREREREFRADLRHRTPPAPSSDEVEQAMAEIDVVPPNDPLMDGDVSDEESSSGWDSTSSPGEFINNRAIISTPERRAWSQGDLYLMTGMASPGSTQDVATTPMRGSSVVSIGTNTDTRPPVDDQRDQPTTEFV